MEHNYFKPMDDEDRTQPSNPIKLNSIPSTNETTTDDSITRCICDFDHDDGFMIFCDKCSVWQHVDCVVNNRNCIPDIFLCEMCHPRKLDRHRAIRIQSKKRDDFEAAVRGEDDSSATETEDETKNEAHDSPDNANNRLYIPNKRPHPSGSPDRISAKRQLTRSHRNEKIKKESRSDKLKRNDADKRVKRKKKVLQKREVDKISSDNGLLQILEAISHKEQKPLKLPTQCNNNFNHMNSYTPELQKLLPNIKYNQDNLSSFSSSELNGLSKSLCKVTCLDDNPDKLILKATDDLLANCPILEYVGKVMLRDQFHDKWQPHVLFYSKLCGLDLCIDATHFGGDARHVRRSCTPNAEIRHYLQGNSLRFFLHATKSILSGSEITIGFDFNYHKCGFQVECACTRGSCPVARFQRKECSLKRSHSSKNNNQETTSNNHNNSMHNKRSGKLSSSESSSLQSPMQSPVKTSDQHKTLTSMPSCLNKVKTNSQNDSFNQRTSRYSTSRDSDGEHADAYRKSPNEEKENSKKKTREEKKLEDIVKVFLKLEKSEVKKKSASNNPRLKKGGRKLHFSGKKKEAACIDSVADAAAALASLAGNVDMSTFHKEDIQNISKRYAMQQTSTTSISPDAFDMIASNFDAQKHRQPSTSSNSTDCMDGSSCSPGSRHGTTMMKEVPSSFSSNDTHLDAATTLSMMSHHIQSPGEAHPKVVQGIKTTATAITQSLGWESESLPLHQPEGAFNQNDQENKGCSAKKRWLNRAMTSSQSSDGDFATPPKKRRLARESMASEDNTEGDAPEPSQSPDDQKPPVAKYSYQPVCESITDDEDDGQQNSVQGNMICVPPGMIYSPFASLATTGLYSIHPSHPLYSMPGAMIDPYQYYSSLNLLQNMAMTSTPLLHPYATQANGIPTTCGSTCGSDSDAQSVNTAPAANGKSASGTQADACSISTAQQVPHFAPPSHPVPQQFFQKNHVMDTYLPLIRPLVVFPGGPQFSYPVAVSMQSIGPQILNGAVQSPENSVAFQENQMQSMNEESSRNEALNRVARVKMVSPPLPTTLIGTASTTCLDSGSLS